MIGSQVKIGSMNLQYRIKVEVKNNGEKQYIPQVGTPKLTICKRSVYPWLDWKNLFSNSMRNAILKYPIMSINGDGHTIKSMVDFKKNGVVCNTEQEAEEIIEFYKQAVERIELNKVKSVYYINK